LLRILANCESPSAGKISFFGKVAAFQRIGNPRYDHMTCSENLAIDARAMGVSIGDARRALARLAEFSGMGPLLDLPSRRVDRMLFQDLGVSFQCCLDYDILIADELARPRQEKVSESWMSYLHAAPDIGKTVILSSRDTSKLLPHCTHLLLIDQAAVLAYGPTADVKAEFGEFLDRAAAATIKAGAQADMLGKEIDDDDEYV
jgi:ABC-type polysaccharide/polyol phosphate transport system ATPase subunit